MIKRGILSIEDKKKGRWRSHFTWAQVIKKVLGSTCAYCEVKDKLDIHHIIPLSRGGENEMANLELVCKKCHNEIHKTWENFLPPKKGWFHICKNCEVNFETLQRNSKTNLCKNCTVFFKTMKQKKLRKK